jgi:hypothetical protein
LVEKRERGHLPSLSDYISQTQLDGERSLVAIGSDGADGSYEAFLARSSQTAHPYLDLANDHLQNPSAQALLHYHIPMAGQALPDPNHAFLQYWMYYPSSHGVYNGTGVGSNNLTHEGDWEMAQFTVRLADPEKPFAKEDWVQPYAATASQHYYGQTLAWRVDPPTDSYDTIDQTHVEPDGQQPYRPRVYVASNGHATYFRDGQIDSDIFTGCPTSVQYSTPAEGYDAISSENQAVYRNVGLVGLSGSRLFKWSGSGGKLDKARWGETYSLTGAGFKTFPGPASPKFRYVGMGDEAKNADNFVLMAQQPQDFHNQCLSKTVQGQIEGIALQ